MKILKFLGLILFNIVYLYINYSFYVIYYLFAFFAEGVKLPPLLNNLSDDFFLLLPFFLTWIIKFLFFPILLTIGSKIKYIKNLVKIIKDNIIDKKSTLILALLFDCTLLLLAVINAKLNLCDWFDLFDQLFILCGGGILPVYLSMSLWSFLNKDNI